MCTCGIYGFYHAEDGIGGLVRSRGLGDGYERQAAFPVVRVFAVAAIRVDRLSRRARAVKLRAMR